MEDKLENGKKDRILNVIDEFTRECLASEVAFSIKQHDVIELLRYLFLVRGCPAYLRSDNGSQFTAARSEEISEVSRRRYTIHRARQSVGEPNTNPKMKMVYSSEGDLQHKSPHNPIIR